MQFFFIPQSIDIFTDKYIFCIAVFIYLLLKKMFVSYLEELLKPHNIQISRKETTRTEKPENWFSTKYYTDVITITLGRQDNKNQKPAKGKQNSK